MPAVVLRATYVWSAIAVVTFVWLSQLSALGVTCTGEQEKNDCKCATASDCQVEGTGCTQRITANDHSCCVDGDAADNCHSVTGSPQLCGIVYKCDRVGASCFASQVLQYLGAVPVSSEGDCTIPT
jgi:hypothetical protein